MGFLKLAYNFRAVDNLGMAYLKYAIPTWNAELSHLHLYRQMKYPKLLFLFFGIILFKQSHAQDIEQWGRFELTLKSQSQKNAFKDVTLTAEFSNSDTTYTVSGFYDGNDIFKIRFMPQVIGNLQII